MSTPRPSRLMWRTVGFVALASGAVGIVLPLVPTTPFLLVAAYAFQRSSPRLHTWLHTHSHFGPIIENWRRSGSIDRRTKGIAVLAMIATPLVTWYLGASPWILGLQGVLLAGAALFVLTRPDAPRGVMK